VLYSMRLAGTWVAWIPRGPLLFSHMAGSASDLTREILAMSRMLGISVLAVQPPEGAFAIDQAITNAGFRLGVPQISPDASIRINLRLSDEDLLQKMKAMRRENIRKALNTGFDIGLERDIRVFHRLHMASAARQDFVPVSRENLQAQAEFLVPLGKCAAFTARYRGVPIAGLWLTRFGDTVTAKLAGWDAGIRGPPHANEALHWTALRWAREQGARNYDLGGFDRRSLERILRGDEIPDTFWRSPNFFKLAFGGAPVLLPQTRFLFTHKLTDRTLGYAAQCCLPLIGWCKFVQRLRNGGMKGSDPEG
jgi:hypothetical protein